jgi:Holliday junction resolvasome RuvABC DNA-binding subunit
LHSDEKQISSISGIGKKTSAKIILDLQDKVRSLAASGFSDKNQSGSGSHILSDAFNALEVLGFDALHINNALKNITQNTKDLKLEDLIKQTLKLLNKK